jgi:tRNA A22 N-methylase
VQPELQWKGMSFTKPGCLFVALGIQHAMRMRHIVICGLSGPKIFSILSHLQHDFREKVLNLKYKACPESKDTKS